MSSNPSLSLNPLLGTLSCSLMLHIHLTILISARWSATSFSFLTDQVSLPCNILLRTQLLYNLPLTIYDISLLVSNGTNCLHLFYPIRILVSTAASASPSTLNTSWSFLYPISNIWKQHFICPQLAKNSLSVGFWMVCNWSWYFSWHLLGRVANPWDHNDPIYPCRSSTAESLKTTQSAMPVNKQPRKWHLTTKILW